jgi:hypothetical protein
MVMDLIWALAVILIVMWIFGFAFLHVSSAFIHLLLVFAVLAVVVRLITGRRI